MCELPVSPVVEKGVIVGREGRDWERRKSALVGSPNSIQVVGCVYETDNIEQLRRSRSCQSGEQTSQNRKTRQTREPAPCETKREKMTMTTTTLTLSPIHTHSLPLHLPCVYVCVFLLFLTTIPYRFQHRHRATHDTRGKCRRTEQLLCVSLCARVQMVRG